MLRGSCGVFFGWISDVIVLLFLIFSFGFRDFDRYVVLDWCIGGENLEEMGFCLVLIGISLIWFVN